MFFSLREKFREGLFRSLFNYGRLRPYGPLLTAMPNNLDRASAGYDAALCAYLSAAGSAAVSALAWSAVTGTPVAVAPAVAIAGISAMAWANSCYWDPEGESTLPPGEDNIVLGSCLMANGCGLRLLRKNGESVYIGPVRELISVKSSGTYPNGAAKVTTVYIDCDGIEQSDDEAAEDLLPVTTELLEGFSCRKFYTGADADPMNFVYEYNDGQCINNFDFQGFLVEPTGTYSPVFEISPAGKVQREDGEGPVDPEDCAFNNIVIYKSPGAFDRVKPIITPPPPPDPPDKPPWWDPDYDPPPWLQPILEALPWIVTAFVSELTEFLFERTDPKVYRLEAPCNKDDEGNPEVKTWVTQGQNTSYEVLARVDNLALMLQQHIDWKHLVCMEPTDKSGDLRTISFISDETSPFGKSRLRKRFRYRSKSGVGSDAIVTWWKDFTFAAGPVCVQHYGSSLGAPQVWAASIDEGKRVIRHAATEAGVDPDQVGEWRVSGSNDPRFGVQGTMRVNTKGGYYWISERLGSNNRPLVAET